jgi:hypothetical protein
MPNKVNKSDGRLFVRISPKTKKQMVWIAREKDISLTKQVEFAIVAYVKAYAKNRVKPVEEDPFEEFAKEDAIA